MSTNNVTCQKRDDLKPCPFCGSKDVVLIWRQSPYNDGGFHFVKCQDCMAQGGISGTSAYITKSKTLDKAVALWNMRTEREVTE